MASFFRFLKFSIFRETGIFTETMLANARLLAKKLV